MVTGSLARVANGQQKFEGYEQALAFVRETLIAQVTEQAQAAGAENVVVDCEE